MSIETGVVVNLQGEPIHWHLPPGRSAGYLPDSRDLWDVFWENRDNLLGFAHSHPGAGYPHPSHEDLTTFSAVEAGLGRRLLWWVMSKTSVVVYSWVGPGLYDYRVNSDREAKYASEDSSSQQELSWVAKLYSLSYVVNVGSPEMDYMNVDLGGDR